MRDGRLQILASELLALRAAVGTVQAQIDALAATVDILQVEDPPPPCPHRHKENIGTIGAPLWECQDCGESWSEQ